MRGLVDAGWREWVSVPYLRVFTAPDARLDVVGSLDGHGVLIGEMFDQPGRRLGRHRRAVLASEGLTAERARSVVTQGWGRYVLIRRVRGETAVLRDPSGAIEAVVWRRAGVTVVASHPDFGLDCFLPDDVGIDWTAVENLVRRPGQFRHRLALIGLTPVAAGELRTIGPDSSRGTQAWSPSEIYRRGRSGPRPNLREAVERAVRGLAGRRAWVMEVSGGLDSAIVAGALTPVQRQRVTAWVNHFVEQPEGDERAYARPVVEAFGAALCEVRRQDLGVTLDWLKASGCGFRPAANDLDPDYNADIATRVQQTGAWGSLTGQGGDAVFFQMPTALIALDEIAERGRQARLPVIHRVARWTRRSVWPWAWMPLLRRRRDQLSAIDHPWLADLEGVPPAKTVQISALAACQIFQMPAARSLGGPCVNPLLSQPVMEAGLALSAVDLTWGGRDRAAARDAFRDRLPLAVFQRRSKGELGAYYGEAVAAKLDVLRPWLLEGELAKRGMLPGGLDQAMTRDVLIWRGGFSTLLSLALTEAWVRHWVCRLGELPGCRAGVETNSSY